MDILKRELAPLSENAWKEIDSRAEKILKSYLSGRKTVNVIGPKGLDYTVISEGRLDLIDETNEDVEKGIYKVKPLVETRVRFKLNLWEMDNIARGAKDIDLDNLDEAVKKIALFEENAIYNGYKSGNITGLTESSQHQVLSFGNNGSEIMESISSGMIQLKENFQEGPFSLIVGSEAWKRLNREVSGTPLISRIESLLGSKIIYSTVVKDALLIPYDHDDLELTIGQDFTIGYESSTDQEVTLFLAESFTFRVLDGNIIIQYKVD